MAPGYPGQDIDELMNNQKGHEHNGLSGSEHMGGGSPGEDPEADAQLKDQILTHLHKHTEINTSRVKVAAKDSSAFLSGSVDSKETRATIVALVENISGVEDVTSFLQVESPVDRYASGASGIHDLPS